MNKQEYEDYKNKFATFFDVEGISNLSREMLPEEPCKECGCQREVCQHCKEEISNEGYFTSTGCDVCNSFQGATELFHASGYDNNDGEIYCYEVCRDCLYYAEYGQLDDMTMMDIGE